MRLLFVLLIFTAGLSAQVSIRVDQALDQCVPKGQGFATLVVSASGGTAPYYFELKAASGESVPVLDTSAVDDELVTFNVLGGSRYVVAVADAVGARDTTAPVFLKFDATPPTVSLLSITYPTSTASLDGELVALVKDSRGVVRSLTDGGSITWSTGSSGFSSGPISAGTYSYTYTSRGGCTAILDTTIVAKASAPVTLDSIVSNPGLGRISGNPNNIPLLQNQPATSEQYWTVTDLYGVRWEYNPDRDSLPWQPDLASGAVAPPRSATESQALSLATEIANVDTSGTRSLASRVDLLVRELSLREVDSPSAMVGRFYPRGVLLRTRGYYAPGDGGRATYVVQKDSLAGYPVDSVAVIPVIGGYAILQFANGVANVQAFGAKDRANYFVRKNPIAPPAPTAADFSDDAFRRAIAFLNAQTKLNTKTNPRVLVYDGQYYINDLEIRPANGVEIHAVGTSMLHVAGNQDVFVFDGHVSMTHTVRLSRKTWIGTTTSEWYPTGNNLTPLDTTSTGVRIANSRNSFFYVTAMKFVDGILLQGDGDGNVNNVIYGQEVFNNRYNYHILNVNGGWSNSNTFIGGRANGTGLVGRNYAVDIDCAYLKNNSGDNNTFVNLNFEGSTNYKYAVYNDGPYNVFLNCRLEGVRAKQLYFTENSKGSSISGYGLINIETLVPLGVYYSTSGSAATIPTHPDGSTIFGSIWEDRSFIPTINAAGSTHLPGADYFSSQGENTSLKVESQSNTDASSLARFLRDEKDVFRISAAGTIDYFGPAGLSMKARAERKGSYDTITYSAGAWLATEKFVESGGNVYMARNTFRADGVIDNDLASGNLVLVSGETQPAFSFRDNGADTEQLGGVPHPTSGVVQPPVLVDGIAFEVESVVSTAATTASVNVAEKSIIVVNHTLANSECSVTLDASNVPNGSMFALTTGVDNGSTIRVAAAGVVKALDGGTEVVVGHREIVWFVKLSNIVQEISRTWNGIRRVGTTAQRPVLSARRDGWQYYDTDLRATIIWDGSAWLTPDYAKSSHANPYGGTNTLSAAIDSTALEAMENASRITSAESSLVSITESNQLIEIVVPADSTFVDVPLPVAQPDTNYRPVISSPNFFLGNYSITNVTASSFRVNHTNPAPSDGSGRYYYILRRIKP
ncbi:hypothetical protein [Lewinella sp. JB7]|uniref:hypothetical protein n=1 Tax=Lewinella sp. JB7 TaxID=2962887 RepID=UPI0020C96CC8|nr:hypothetical protein [Lewinella sp. JB7]MCP9237163.1 hypothetical protein [Lewinella sp. JB7]